MADARQRPPPANVTVKAVCAERAFKNSPVARASYEDIVDHCCAASNTLIEQPWRIVSIGLRK
jgi:hypothetical protein